MHQTWIREAVSKERNKDRRAWPIVNAGEVLSRRVAERSPLNIYEGDPQHSGSVFLISRLGEALQVLPSSPPQKLPSDPSWMKNAFELSSAESKRYKSRMLADKKNHLEPSKINLVLLFYGVRSAENVFFFRILSCKNYKETLDRAIDVSSFT